MGPNRAAFSPIDSMNVHDLIEAQGRVAWLLTMVRGDDENARQEKRELRARAKKIGDRILALRREETRDKSEKIDADLLRLQSQLRSLNEQNGEK